MQEQDVTLVRPPALQILTYSYVITEMIIKVSSSLCEWERVIILTCFPELKCQWDKIIRKPLYKYKQTVKLKFFAEYQDYQFANIMSGPKYSYIGFYPIVAMYL